MLKPDKGTADELTERFVKATDGKLLNRRSFLTVCAVLGISPAVFRLTPAYAAGTEIVLVNSGGDAVTAARRAFADPFMAANPGVEVIVDGSSATSGSVRAMVQSGSITWDVLDRNLPASLELGREGLLEEMDYSIVDPGKVRPEHVGQWGVGSYMFSFVLAWDTTAFDGRHPENWVDFWNVTEFPGRRMMRKHIDGQLEAALMADGVAPEDIYPIDVDRALAKIMEIKEHAYFWATGAESQQLFRDREVVLGNMFSTRAFVAHQETQGEITFTYNQGSVWPAAWLVIKDNPAGKAAFDLIASMQDPQAQALLFEILGNGPINPEADQYIPEELKRFNAGSQENYPLQVLADAEWYAANSAEVLNRYIEAVS